MSMLLIVARRVDGGSYVFTLDTEKPCRLECRNEIIEIETLGVSDSMDIEFVSNVKIKVMHRDIEESIKIYKEDAVACAHEVLDKIVKMLEGNC